MRLVPAAKRPLTVLVTLLCGCILHESAWAQQSRRVRGWVQGLAPGDSAVIRLSGPATLECSTRPGGAWNAEGARPGVYQAVPTSPGYRFDPPSRSVKVGNSDVNAVNFRAISTVAPVALPPDDLPATGLAIRGRIRGLIASDRLVMRAAGPVEVQAMTGPGGKYELPGLLPGTYRLFFEDARYRLKPAQRNVTIQSQDRNDILFSARRVPGLRSPAVEMPKPVEHYTVSGRIDGLKALLYGCTRATVEAKGPVTRRVKSLKSENEFDCGSFQLADLTAGRYQIRVWIQSNAFEHWTVTPPTRTVDVDQNLSGLEFEAESRESDGRRRRGHH